jgi:hypothetical protein
MIKPFSKSHSKTKEELDCTGMGSDSQKITLSNDPRREKWAYRTMDILKY